MKKMREKPASALPDYQQEFSKRSVRNYIAAFFVPFGFNGLSAMLFSTYLSFVYTEYLGVSAAAIAGVVSFGVIVDGVTDFLMGILADRVISKWGKAKHWFLVSALPVGIFMSLMWMVPEQASQTMKLVWAFIIYNLFCTALTTVRVPGNALPALMTDSNRVRGNIAWVITIATALASSCVGWIVSPMVGAMGESLATYRIISVVCAVLATLSLLITGFLTQEMRGKSEWQKIREEYARMHQDKGESVWAQIANLLKNRWWVQFLLTNMFQACGIFFIFGVLAYWVQFVAGDMTKMAILFTALNIPNTIGSIAYGFVSRFFKHNKTMEVICIGMQMICAYVMWFAGAGAFGVMIAALCVKSFFGGLGAPLDKVFIPMVIDYGEWKTGSRQENLCNAGSSVMSKIVTAVATALVGVILTMNGYEGGGVASAQAVSAINFLFFGVPALTMTLAFILWCTWGLSEEKIAQYRSEIAARKGEKVAD